MKKFNLLLLVACGLCVAMVAACGGGDDGNGGAKPGPKSKEVKRKPVPADFKGKAADLDTSADTIAKGKVLYEGAGICKDCHGSEGKGDGEAGKALPVKPTDLTSTEFQDAVENDYIYWRISTGTTSAPVGVRSAMSGLGRDKDDTEEQHHEKIRQLVAYVRSLKAK